MADFEIRIEGMDELIKLLDSLARLDPVKAAIQAAGEYLAGKMREYPPASEANQPGSRQWYQRGYGTKWITRSGAVHGIATSEDLQHSWTQAIADDGLTSIVGTNVSYAPYVQDRDEQAWFHKARGWITAQDTVEAEGDFVVNLIARSIEDEIEKAAGG